MRKVDFPEPLDPAKVFSTQRVGQIGNLMSNYLSVHIGFRTRAPERYLQLIVCREDPTRMTIF